MIITRTPFRISFFGGGTDYPVWYREHGGAVLSTTINKYCYISSRHLPPFFHYNYLIRYRVREEVMSLADISHPSVRECLRHTGIKQGIEMVHTGDIPARSGIGSSSAFTVGFLNSLYALQGRIATKRQLAREAIDIEQNRLGENVGSQDQVAAAFGGLNKIEFGGATEFYVRPITIGPEKLARLQSRLLLFFTGFSRNAHDIAGEQIRSTPARRQELKTMGEMVDQAIAILDGQPEDMDDFGRLLHESWMLKRSLTSLISNDAVDDFYSRARQSGALGGKLLGAGGGGFILFYAPPENHDAIRRALAHILHVPFRFEALGTQTILYSTQEEYPAPTVPFA
jgi:D-glycero-alpha-D-manno-heptose-7-phosphate kinase